MGFGDEGAGFGDERGRNLLKMVANVVIKYGYGYL
jgi:hypothetical protein